MITVDRQFCSIFSETCFDSHIRGAMVLTEHIMAKNLRLRRSVVGYTSDWHVAGDPTLIMIQQGTLRIILQDQSWRDFSAGDAFIATDFLPEHRVFDPSIHGHRAAVIGDQDLLAIHIKLMHRPDVTG